MNKSLQLRRGSTLQHSTFTGLEGEVTVDTDKDTLVLHDGQTVGGIDMARYDFTVAELSTKANIADSLEGYGILDAYDKTYIDENYYNRLEIEDWAAIKADIDTIYTQDQLDAMFSTKADAELVYSKSDIDNLLLNIDVDGLPAQENNAGKFLSTDGGMAYWTDIDQVVSVTNIELSGNTLFYTNNEGDIIEVDLSQYASNDLNTIVSAVLNGTVITFTRSDATTFDVDVSALYSASNIVTSFNGNTGDIVVDLYEVPTDQGANNFLAGDGTYKEPELYTPPTNEGAANFLAGDGTYKSVPQNLACNTYEFIAEDGQNIFSGIDKNGQTLTYDNTSTTVSIYHNRLILLQDEYTLSDNSTLVLGSSCDAGDVVILKEYVLF
jgi:hypothetical protein